MTDPTNPPTPEAALALKDASPEIEPDDATTQAPEPTAPYDINTVEDEEA